MIRGQALCRRTFLCASATAGIAALTSGPAHASAPLNIGVIGCGRRGTELLSDLTARNEVRVVGVSDACLPRLKAAAALGHATPYSSWQDLAAHDTIDAVVIATPDHLHAPMAMAAMRAGKDVYCEPPMALNAADALAVCDSARATGRIVQIGAQEPFEGQWQVAQRLIQQERLGRVVRCHAARSCRRESQGTLGGVLHAGDVDWLAFLGPATARPFDSQRLVNWSRHWDYSAGSAANDLFGSLAAFLLATDLESPSCVSAAGGIYAGDGGETPDSLMVTAIYPDGATVVLATSPVQKRTGPPVIRGEHASVFCEGNTVRVVPEGAADSAGSLIPAATAGDPMTDWLDCVRTRRQPVCNADLGYRTTLAMCMALQAYRERRQA